MDKNIKQVIRDNRLTIKLNSIMLNVTNDTLSLEQVFLLYSRYLQDRYDDFKKEVKPIEGKIIRELHEDFEFEYSLNFSYGSKHVDIKLISNSSNNLLKVSAKLDYFYKAIERTSHIIYMSSKDDNIRRLESEFVDLAEQYRFFINKTKMFSFTYPSLRGKSIVINLRNNNIKLVDLEIILHNKNEDSKCITITYDYDGNYQTDISNNTFSSPWGYYVTDEETIAFIEKNVLANMKIPIKELPDFLLKYINSVEEKEEVEDNLIVNNDYLVYQKIEENNKIINELIEENRKLRASLDKRTIILKDELFKEVKDNNDSYFVIREEYRYHLQDFDLSKISFDNVDIRGIDFRGTNINSAIFDLQKVYNKDASCCDFSVDEGNSKDYIFGYSTDFTGVKLNGTKLYNPYPCFLNSTIYDAYIDKYTLLPDYYAESIESSVLRGKVKIKI